MQNGYLSVACMMCLLRERADAYWLDRPFLPIMIRHILISCGITPFSKPFLPGVSIQTFIGLFLFSLGAPS